MHTANDEDEALLCLTLLETVVAYRYLPVTALRIALGGLCRIVNVPHLANRVVKVSLFYKLHSPVPSMDYRLLTSLLKENYILRKIEVTTWTYTKFTYLNATKQNLSYSFTCRLLQTLSGQALAPELTMS